MLEYDVIVIGSGSGVGIVGDALADGLKVALVDRGPLGGTCPNLGCIPTKVLVYPADRVMEIREAAKLGIEAKVERIDFGAVMAHMRWYVGDILADAQKRITSDANKEYQEIPVVLLTGVGEHIYDSKYPLKGVMQADADEYLEKPVKPEVLLETISKLIKK